MNKKALCVGLGIAVIVGGGFVGLQIPLKKKYDGLMHKVSAATQFVAHPMDAEAHAFLESVKGSWTIRNSDIPDSDSAFLEISSVTGIRNTVDGVVEFYTHKIPPYSFFDYGQNKKESSIAMAKAIAVPTSMDRRVYHSEGVCFVKLNEGLVEVFENAEQGLSRTLYMKAKSGEQSATERPATAPESKREGNPKPIPEAAVRTQ